MLESVIFSQFIDFVINYFLSGGLTLFFIFLLLILVFVSIRFKLIKIDYIVIKIGNVFVKLAFSKLRKNNELQKRIK